MEHSHHLVILLLCFCYLSIFVPFWVFSEIVHQICLRPLKMLDRILKTVDFWYELHPGFQAGSLCRGPSSFRYLTVVKPREV